MISRKGELRSYEDLPGPTPLPLIGNLFRFRFDSMHLKLEEWAEEYGKLYRFSLGPKKIAVLSDAEIIKEIHRERPNKYRRTRSVERCSREMGIAGVFSVEGEDWQRQRKVVATALNPKNLRAFFPRLKKTSERLLNRWQRCAQDGEEIDLCRELMRMTVDVTTQLAFGMDFNTIETNGPVIQRHMDKVFPMMHQRTNAPFPYWRYFKLSKDRALDRALTGLKEEVDTIIGNVRERMKKDRALYDSPTNFLEAIISAKETEGVDFSDQDIFANVCTLLLAGEDTTANTIAWTANYFMQKPECLDRARDEIDQLLGKAPLPQEIDCLANMPFLEAFYNESMRLKPVAPLGAVEPLDDVDILGFEIPRGMVIMTLHRHIACQEQNFGEGSKFQPQRWLSDTGSSSCPHNTTAFIPFGVGPRFCPGRNLALLQIKQILSLLIKNFDIELCNKDNVVKERLAFAMMPSKLVVRIKKRA